MEPRIRWVVESIHKPDPTSLYLELVQLTEQDHVFLHSVGMTWS